MTEAEWLTTEDPQKMLHFLFEGSRRLLDRTVSYPVSDRKLRLFAVACCRQVWHLLTDERSRRAVEVAERFADREATKDEREIARVAAHEVLYEPITYSAQMCCLQNAEVSANMVGYHVMRNATNANLLREIVGNPFRPVRRSVGLGELLFLPDTLALIDEDWLTPTVLAIAQAAYEQRAEDGTLDPARLAVLADALEDAGCDNIEILNHLRGLEQCPNRYCLNGGKHLPGEYPTVCFNCNGKGTISIRGPHVRGCWVIDLILGRE